MEKARYFVTLPNFHTDFSLIKFLHRKNEVTEGVIQMVPEVKYLFSSRMKRLSTINLSMVKSVRLERGREYVGFDVNKRMRK